MDQKHIEFLKKFTNNLDEKKVSDSNYWRKRAKKVLGTTTIDREIYGTIDHTKGEGVWLYDVEGNKYLDLTGGVAVRALGLRYKPQIEFEKEIADLAIELPGQDFDAIPQTLLAEKLVELAPGDFDKGVVFTTSGGRAVENCAKSAMDLKGRTKFVAFKPAFHGRTGYSLAFTASKSVHKNKFPQGVDVIRAPYAYCYRCPFGQDPESCNLECAEYLRDSLEHEGNDINAIVVEPLGGEGGILVPPSKWIQELRKIADEYDAFLIDDEVQAGMGRTGKWWAIEHHGVVPDYMSIAKAIGGGYPLGASIGPQPMFTETGRHSETFSAEPKAAMLALFVINEIEKNHLIENAAKMGDYFIKRLKELQQKHEVIGDVRGLGLMLGIEIVEDPKTKKAAPKLRNKIIKNAVQKEHLWMIGAGTSVIRFTPSYIITKEEIDMAIERLDKAISEAK